MHEKNVTEATNILIENEKETFFDPRFKQFGKIKKIAFVDKKINISLQLKGLEDKEIVVTCGTVRIAEDGSSITICDFSANIECVSTALNLFAARDIPIPENGIARNLVQTLKTVLDL